MDDNDEARDLEACTDGSDKSLLHERRLYSTGEENCAALSSRILLDPGCKRTEQSLGPRNVSEDVEQSNEIKSLLESSLAEPGLRMVLKHW